MTNGRLSTLHRYLLSLVILTGLWSLLCVALQLGIDHTPWETIDSKGRPMGFNDRLSYEHYRIMLGNVRVSFPDGKNLFGYGYDFLLLAMIGIGGWSITSAEHNQRRRTRWFFLLQSALFPIGWLALPFAPKLWLQLFTEQLDRESFIDIPFDWLSTQPVWVVVSLTIALAMPGESLDFKTVLLRGWQKLAQRT